jgi:very-short-patch-repair endonuclease
VQVAKTSQRDILEKARELRTNKTKAERLAWTLLRNRQRLNYKFRRQQPIEDGSRTSAVWSCG